MLTVDQLLNPTIMQSINSTKHLTVKRIRKARYTDFIKQNNRTYKTRVPKKYKVYIVSKWWTKRKNKFFQRFGKKCFVCGSSRRVQLHHKYYGDFGSEKDEHLIALCIYHHEQLHMAIVKTKRDMIKETDMFIAEMKRSMNMVKEDKSRTDFIRYIQ